MKIVRAESSHIPGIVEVWVELMAFHQDIDPRFPMVEDARLKYEKHLRDLMAAENTLVLVAVDEGDIVGYSVAQINQSTPIFHRETYGIIEAAAVKAAYRRKSIGTCMLAETLDWFGTKDTDMIELSVAARNQVGYSFWKKHGFKDYLHRLYLKTK